MMDIMKESKYNIIYDPNHYLDEWFVTNQEEPGDDALREIQMIIDDVKKIKNSLPIKIYRGINTKYPKSDYDNSCWSTDKKISEYFGDTVFVGIISDDKYVDWEETIRARVLLPYEQEINIPESEGVEIIDTYRI